MIELRENRLIISCPEVHEDARTEIHFQRTLRIPDDGKVHHLPPGLGNFPLEHVDDFARAVPPQWIERGGVMLPMYQSEAMWICFSRSGYPFALKIGAGKINAVTGETWTNDLQAMPQDYVVSSQQPWIDGFCVKKGTVRQFVAMPLGHGYTAEEQLTGTAEYGGIQIIAYPMKGNAYEALCRRRQRLYVRDPRERSSRYSGIYACAGMGLAPGGEMRQEIYENPYSFDDWDRRHPRRCFVHIANSEDWASITGRQPPHGAPTAREYTEAGLTWFDYYSDAPALEGGTSLKRLKSVKAMGEEFGEQPLPENESLPGLWNRVRRIGRRAR